LAGKVDTGKESFHVYNNVIEEFHSGKEKGGK
jgi:hypothetical protein